MFNHGSNYSLSDIAAVTGRQGGGSGWGDGDNAWWIILLFLFAGGWGNGYGFGGGNGAAGSTLREEIAYGFDMNGLENSVRGIQQGLCDGFYSMNTGMLNGFSGVQSTLCQGFAGVTAGVNQSTNDIIQTINADTIANMQNTNALTAQLNAMAADQAACCCETKTLIGQNFADLNYNLATQACATQRAISDSTRDIIDSNNAGIRSILDFLTQDKIATLTAENQSLKFQASQSAQNAFITANQEAQTAEIVRRLETPCPIPAYVVPNPNCCYTPVVSACNGFCN